MFAKFKIEFQIVHNCNEYFLLEEIKFWLADPARQRIAKCLFIYLFIHGSKSHVVNHNC